MRRFPPERIACPTGETVEILNPLGMIPASWCGKKLQPGKIAARAGREAILAGRGGRIAAIRSLPILQSGPAALTDGLDAIVAALACHYAEPDS